MTPEIISKKQPEFQKAVDHLKNELATLRTGRASTGLVENIVVDFYGTATPLMHMAQISVPEPRMIAIQPFDKNSLKDIEKAIQASNLGINPVNDGLYIRLTIPQMTEDRRKELVRVVSQMAEKARISVRNIREDIWKEIQTMEKDGKIGEDGKISGKEDLQKMVDKFNDEIKKIAEAKEKEVLTI
ncbi:MAG: ribosome recycling factor [Candidatus Doudnabacteria bacterium RIFCSPLOWO2_02_FULL_49_13]|uniref:Ribosome-recycling factor n=1 Tax=Candidatus Doudnabacteria bacterium RIFCSPHIGHO2_12_FULL_48_16 TaxID=1817838 RepID=A0A1F5PJ33_9BACT|nr:MAG: ribosome recycling factor [Candidatus Doudnabacteria bacterium RIFCSPHIGHO2_02_FULL_49_24]OGE89356.1 MAG: ribosome recycling factor [Candidatus Doudnabacteria bacterium RIFCSPHIGHO2_01_FULL_50_67]OGE89953.1 MAG: ribosome recycling factor [Candidatus Doudnabacteria bacterium RIFCSPHIGHO2_12_FULL_48_16]OGE97502.1 MAG: ribosome recycling factor [Candidatus Doudnabacteria bacterium RIFCSPLOWO2_01_FULL_49_40]OGF03094.1 MAG: ribosome recycling factor [Candidatus Doudnabacteria bacterium RIFCS